MAPARRTVVFGRDVGRPHPVLVPEGHPLLRNGNRTRASASPLAPRPATTMKAKTPERRQPTPRLIDWARATFRAREAIPVATLLHTETGGNLWDDFSDENKYWIIDQAIYNDQRAKYGRPVPDVFPFDVRNVDVERLLYRYTNCGELQPDGLDCLLKEEATAEEILPVLHNGNARATMSIGPHTGAMPPMLRIPSGICRNLKFWHVGFRISHDHADGYLTIEVRQGNASTWRMRTVQTKQRIKSAAALQAATKDMRECLDDLETLLRCMTRDPEFNGLGISQIELLARAMGNPIKYGNSVA